MSETAVHPTTAELARLATLQGLPGEELSALSQRLFVCEGRKGTELLALGAAENNLLFLLEGNCQLVAEDGGVTRVSHNEIAAQAPLARLRPSRYRVQATSPVRYLLIDEELIEPSNARSDRPPALSLESYEVDEGNDDDDMGAENRLTLQIYEDLNANRLLLPSLPHVAVRIGEAVKADDADARKIATLIESDPAMAVKLVKAANSARFGGADQVRTVNQAVARLGLQNTQILVITFALREMFRTPSKMLEKRMITLWEHSRRIAALAQVLAERVGSFNIHEALLAGLVHDIGVLAVIGYANEFPEVADEPAALEVSIRALRAQLGGMILSTWDLPDAFIVAAKEAENWRREGTGDPDFADLVIVAQAHEGLAGGLDKTEIPAIARLGLDPDEIGEGAELLTSSHKEVEAAKRLLAG